METKPYSFKNCSCSTEDFIKSLRDRRGDLSQYLQSKSKNEVISIVCHLLVAGAKEKPTALVDVNVPK